MWTDNPQRRRPPVPMTIRFARATVKQLLWHPRLAWRCGDRRRVQRLTALVGLAEGQPVTELAERLGVCRERSMRGYAPSWLIDGRVCSGAPRPAGRPS